MHQVVKLGEKPASEAKEAFKKEWAKELSETLWMIGTTKLIFNSNRDEDGQIHTQQRQPCGYAADDEG